MTSIRSRKFHINSNLEENNMKNISIQSSSTDSGKYVNYKSNLGKGCCSIKEDMCDLLPSEYEIWNNVGSEHIANIIDGNLKCLYLVGMEVRGKCERDIIEQDFLLELFEHFKCDIIYYASTDHPIWVKLATDTGYKTISGIQYTLTKAQLLLSDDEFNKIIKFLNE